MNRAPLPSFTSVILRAGNTTFGGGPPTIAALQREFFRRQWIDDSGFALCYALSWITPGTNMLAFYTAAGWIVRGWPGAILALLAGSIPCCLLVWIITAGFDRISANIWMQRAISGALAASVGILLAAFWLLVRPHVKRNNWIRPTAVVAGSIFLSMYVKLSPVTVLLIAAATGLLGKTE